MKKKIYADNAATTKLSENVFDKMKNYLLDDFSNPSQPYSFSRSSKNALKEARSKIASCIGAKQEEIFFTSGGSESDNWAIKCFGETSNNKVIITSCIEHYAILNSCEDERKKGVQILFIPVDSNGLVDLEELEKCLIKYQACNVLVSIMTANNEIGTIEPIYEISKLCHKYGALFHTDAVQAMGHIKIDVNTLGVDMLSASAHKFNGPRGIGFLYIRNGTPITPFVNGGSQENGKRAGTENVPAIVGMSYALEESISKMEETTQMLSKMEAKFIDTLKNNNVDFIRNGYINNHLPGLINVSIKNTSGELLLHRLDLMGYYISTGSACDGKKNQVSHVIKSIKVDNNYAEGTIRISFGRMNQVSDAEELAIALVQILK